jgi:purine-cytosine permease-like protein
MKRYILILFAATYKYLQKAWIGKGDFLTRYFLIFSYNSFVLIIVLGILFQNIFNYRYEGFLKDKSNPLVIISYLIIGYGMIYFFEYFIKKFHYSNEKEIMDIKKDMDIKKARNITFSFQIIIIIVLMITTYLNSDILNP